MKNSDKVRKFADTIDELESNASSDAAKEFASNYGTDLVNALSVVSKKYVEIMNRSFAKKEEETKEEVEP
jgi:hypothetical protein